MSTTSPAQHPSNPNQPRSSLLPHPERNLVSARRGALVISLDFELHWGVRDILPLDAAQRAKLMAARAGIPRILNLFEDFSIHATWATVGLLFARSRKEAERFRPSKQPHYRDTRLNPYQEQLGNDERDDPFHFAPRLIARIAERKGQEIASHSFSHYYCMETGQTKEEFEADLQSAVAIAANAGYALQSYVFPRNQANSEYLPSLERLGIRSFRGNEIASTKMAGAFVEQRRPRKRLARLLDAYVDIDGPQTSAWPSRSPLTSIPASRYLRSYRPVARPFEHLHLRRIGKAMKRAAENGELFHLWWHPEDFAPDCNQNIRLLRRVLETFDHYRAQYGMESLSMSEVLSRSTNEQFQEPAL